MQGEESSPGYGIVLLGAEVPAALAPARMRGPWCPARPRCRLSGVGPPADVTWLSPRRAMLPRPVA